jgi:hypothetical protein
MGLVAIARRGARPERGGGSLSAHLDNERKLLGALTADEHGRLADLLRKLQLGLPAL